MKKKLCLSQFIFDVKRDPQKMLFESMKDPLQKMLFESIKTSQEDLYQTRNKPVLQRDIFTQLIDVICTF